ncbi:MAG: Na+/H+ antiporter NhaA [Sedimenticolaceae bacterium]
MKPELEKQVDRLREPFSAFIGAQITASTLLLIALLAALAFANSPYADELKAIQQFSLRFGFGDQTFDWSLLHLVNDGLIALFFFLIGLEVKREFIAGELQDADRVGLLLCAAVGGMVVPAAFYLAINVGHAEGVVSGWGIPMATDTAIAIGVLAALAARVPKSVVAFLVGVAIIDDIGAILVIAFVYTEQLAWDAVATAGLLLLLLLVLNRAGVRHPLLYGAAGVALWVAIVQSGIHASIAGVIVAIAVPARPRIRPDKLKREVESVVSSVDSEADHLKVLGETKTHRRITEVEKLAQEATTPLRRWENSLELPVALLVLPLFAFLNAGVVVNTMALNGLLIDPVALGIIGGLVLGKPLGILAGVWLGERIGIAKRPDELSQRRLLGIGLIAGIGFTMSTFIAHLALAPGSATSESAKLAILTASFIAAVSGFLVLRFWAR